MATTRDPNDGGTVTVGQRNTVSKGTTIMVIAAIVFLIIAGVLFWNFLSSPTGESGTGTTATNSSSAR
jgi:hypothetical protein